MEILYWTQLKSRSPICACKQQRFSVHECISESAGLQKKYAVPPITVPVLTKSLGTQKTLI